MIVQSNGYEKPVTAPDIKFGISGLKIRLLACQTFRWVVMLLGTADACWMLAKLALNTRGWARTAVKSIPKQKQYVKVYDCALYKHFKNEK